MKALSILSAPALSFLIVGAAGALLACNAEGDGGPAQVTPGSLNPSSNTPGSAGSGSSTVNGPDGTEPNKGTDTGWASIRGETWQVKTAARVARGEKVRVVAIDGMSPRVAPVGGA